MIVADHTQILIIRNWIRCGSNRSIRQIFPKFSFLSSCCSLSCSCASLASHFCCPCLPYFFFDLMYFWPDDPTFLSAVTLIQLSSRCLPSAVVLTMSANFKPAFCLVGCNTGWPLPTRLYFYSSLNLYIFFSLERLNMRTSLAFATLNSFYKGWYWQLEYGSETETTSA